MDRQLPQHSIFRSPYVDLNQHQIDHLQPTAAFNSRCNQAVDALATFLKQLNSFSVAQTVKGGSLSKGTAIREHCDLDLVVFLNGYRDVDAFRYNLSNILQQLREAVRRWDGSGFNKSDLHVSGRVLCITMNKFENGRTYRLRVDIVPAFRKSDPQSLYSEMSYLSPDDRSYYSSSLALEQTQFVSSRPPRLKDLIRLLKFWRKTHLGKTDFLGRKIPKSYALELVAIHVWQRAGSPNSFLLEVMLKKVLLVLANPASIDARWTNYYTQGEADLYSRGTRINGKPFILDPADPFHNVGTDFEWDEMASMARITANSARLMNVLA